jgi:cytochrome c oxidase cbb3-type subunit 3
VLWYHFGAGESVLAEYNADMMEQAEAQTRALLAAGDPTDVSIREMGANPAMMAGAAQIFASRCATCHGGSGEGKIGPNLTDPYWLHGGQPMQIYRTILEGVPDKGMLAWKMQLPPAQVLAMAAYVTTLQGTNPPRAKAPQGEKDAS